MACAALRQAMPGLSFGALWFWASAAIAAEGMVSPFTTTSGKRAMFIAITPPVW